MHVRMSPYQECTCISRHLHCTPAPIPLVHSIRSILFPKARHQTHNSRFIHDETEEEGNRQLYMMVSVFITEASLPSPPPLSPPPPLLPLSALLDRQNWNKFVYVLRRVHCERG